MQRILQIIYMLSLIVFSCVSYADNLTKPIRIDFNNMPTQEALQTLANLADMNLIISNKIKGDVSLHLFNIKIDQALNAILQSQQLTKTQIDGIIYILPMTELKKQQSLQLQTEALNQTITPLQSEIFALNYANAETVFKDLNKNQKQLLSKRGSFGFDVTHNAIWAEDTSSNLNHLKQLINLLDKPTQQVLIQARIVNIDKSKEDQLGLHWYLGSSANQPDDMQQQGFNLDISGSASSNTNAMASMGFNISKLESDLTLDVQLSALEAQGYANIIARPQLITQNQTPAFIESGEEIPFQQAMESGATSVSFKKAVLLLKVIPRITPDQHIILNLTVNQDKKSASLVQGVPTIDTREIQTHVLLKNGQTVVLGGIYQTEDLQQQQKIPGLGNLPIVGRLFQYRANQQQTRELIIFITPKILTDE